MSKDEATEKQITAARDEMDRKIRHALNARYGDAKKRAGDLLFKAREGTISGDELIAMVDEFQA